MKQLSWYTPPIGPGTGYGYAAIETIKALQAKDVSVLYNSPTPGVHINFIQPEYYRGEGFQYRIGYTPWESTGISVMWPTYMNNMDEIWTTSSFCKEVYENSGIKKDIQLVPHGIDPEVFTIYERTVQDKFYFLHIGGGAERKGAGLVTKVFMDLFRKNENVYLVMKSNGPSEARWYDERDNYRGNIDSFPRAKVIDSFLSVEDMAALYHFSHCCVYPSQGEGFGLIPFQAMATGMPTIVTNLTGTTDFAQMGMPLEAEWTDGVGIHLGQWAAPSEEHLRVLMLAAYENWENENKRALQTARIIHANHTWAHVADNILNILGERLEISYGEDG